MKKQLHIRLANDRDKDQWNDFVLRFSDYPCFLYQWKNVLEGVYGHECTYLMAEDQHKIVGVFPIALIKSKLLGVRFYSLPFSDYGGPLLKPSDENLVVIDAFLRSLSSHMDQADYLEVRSPVQGDVAKSLENALTLGNVKYVTFVIDLSKPFDEIWRHNFKKDLRTAIRKAIKNKIEVTKSNFEENLHDFYRLYLLTMKKLGSPPHGIEFFQTVHDLLGDKHVKLFVAKISNKVIGGLVVFLGRHVIYSAYEAIDPKYRKLNLGHMLDSRIIEWGCENGYDLFDFGRTLPGSGVYLFKKHWGGKERILPYYYLGKRIPQQDPREKYTYLSRLWSKMPTCIAKRVGPYIKGGIGH